MTHADEIRIQQNMEILALAKFLHVDTTELETPEILAEIAEYRKLCMQRAQFADKWLLC